MEESLVIDKNDSDHERKQEVIVPEKPKATAIEMRNQEIMNMINKNLDKFKLWD